MRHNMSKIDRTVKGKITETSKEDVRPPLQAIADEIERLMVHGVGTKVIQLPTAQGE